jgi:uncharacterized caspase-like protein
MIPLARIQELLKTAKQALLILDSCFSGTQDGNRSFAPTGRPLVAAGAPQVTSSVAVLSATSRNQISTEDVTGGIFTSALLEGMQGAADANKDGLVSLTELSRFVTSSVRQTSASKQVPQLTGTLDFALAQNSEFLQSRGVESRVAKVQALYQNGKLTPEQYVALKNLIEQKREPRDLKRFLDGEMPENTFLTLVYDGLIQGVPRGKP